MADETHIEWLLEGVDAWNARREAHEFQPELAFADFPEIFCEAENRDQRGTILLGRINLSYTNLRGANLSHVSLSQANLRGAKLNGAILSNTDFHGADLTDAEFSVGNLGGVNLSTATLKRTELIQTNLTGADLTWSQFWQARLYHELDGSANSDTKKDSPKSRGKSFWNIVKKPFSVGIRIGNSEDRCKIRSVSELLERCFEIKSQNKDFTLYFRGERDHTWDLRPSVMRPSDEGEFKLRTNESEMLSELMSRRPEDFSGMSSALEQLVIAQHYGLKTRLLDVTRNPCVALFSACDDRDPTGKAQDNSKDGCLHVFAVPRMLMKPFDSDTISIIANFAKLDRGYQSLLLGKTGRESLNQDPNEPLRYLYSEAMRRIYHFIRQEKPHFEERIDPRDFFRVFVVEPKQSFERIRAQAGAFLISAFHERFEREEILRLNKDIPVYEHYRLTIPIENKEKILQELRLLNFTRETLNPTVG